MRTKAWRALPKAPGHFKSTSCWDGNVGLAGHNRGVANHFGKIHTLEDGDKITYTTKLGTRTYEVFYVGQIEETDFSRPGPEQREYDHADHLCPKCAGDALVRAGPGDHLTVFLQN